MLYSRIDSGFCRVCHRGKDLFGRKLRLSARSNDAHAQPTLCMTTRGCQVAPMPSANAISAPRGMPDGLGTQYRSPWRRTGFPANCDDLVVPNGGPSCGGAITTLQSLATCVGCVVRFKTDCLDALSVPTLKSYPAECRVAERGVYVLGVAARPLDAAWAKALRFHQGAKDQPIGYEDVLLRHALGEAPNDWRRENQASGVMKISRAASTTSSAEGGYIYSRGASAEAVERELRERAVVESQHG